VEPVAVTGAFYKEKDIARDLLEGVTVGVVGFGNQGMAQALCLRDSGVSVLVALRKGSPSLETAKREGLRCVDPGGLAGEADVISLLIPDETIGSFYEDHLKGRLKKGHSICLAHGFAFHYGHVEVPSDVDAFLVSPLGPGRILRELYAGGGGLPAYVAVGNDASGNALGMALSYAKAIGCARAGVWPTTFREETEVDLFGEQAVLCGGLAWLVTRAFEVLTEAGYSPEVAYMECVNQLETLAALISREGPDGMRARISGTALFGELTRGPAIVDENCRERMRLALKQIRSGEFAKEWMRDAAGGRSKLGRLRLEADSHPVAEAGKRVRKLLSD
jgi:ketol-acid reductoisomerase